MTSRSNFLTIKMIVLFLLVFLFAEIPCSAETVIVSAAASLTNAFQEIGKRFTVLHPNVFIRFNFGSSGALQHQIEQGAPVDVFASAGNKEMNILANENLIQKNTRTIFVTNSLVLVCRKGSRLKSWDDLAKPFVKHVAISDPQSVPSGRYAEETLKHKKIWNIVIKKAVLGEDVRQTLSYVVQGDAQAGIVFRTDAEYAAKSINIIATAHSGVDHSPIVYPIALVSSTHHPLFAKEFLEFVLGNTGRAILTRFGFTVPHENTVVSKHIIVKH